MNRRDFLHRTVAAAGLGTAALRPTHWVWMGMLSGHRSTLDNT